MFLAKTIIKRNFTSRIPIELASRRSRWGKPQETLQDKLYTQTSELISQNKRLIEEMNSLKVLVNKRTNVVDNPLKVWINRLDYLIL